jgi:hypothetical protein
LLYVDKNYFDSKHYPGFDNKLLKMYYKVHRLFSSGMTPSQIASYLSIDTRTAKKLIVMSEEEYLDFKMHLSERKKKLSPYEDSIKRRLISCPKASSGQMYCWMKGQNPDFPSVCIKSVYNFLLYVRKKYHLPKTYGAGEYSHAGH